MICLRDIFSDMFNMGRKVVFHILSLSNDQSLTPGYLAILKLFADCSIVLSFSHMFTVRESDRVLLLTASILPAE